MQQEAAYRVELIRRLEQRFPGCFVLKNDPKSCQGIPDILILFRDRWAMLEIKKFTKAKKQPNQNYYIKTFGEMSFAAFIDPEIEEQVLDDLQSAFGASR